MTIQIIVHSPGIQQIIWWGTVIAKNHIKCWIVKATNNSTCDVPVQAPSMMKTDIPHLVATMVFQSISTF